MFPSLLRRVRPYVVPVYDYALDDRAAAATASSPRSAGATGRASATSANQFHYYRQTADNRILFGGYDAVYHFGKKISPTLDQRAETFELLAEHFFETFPQLDGLGSPMPGVAHRLCAAGSARSSGRRTAARSAYATGYTGLGVGATRFGANVMLDLLDGRDTERTATEMVRTKPLPFPPEPIAWLGVTAHPRVTQAGRPRRGTTQPLAAYPRPARPRLRLLAGRQIVGGAIP